MAEKKATGFIKLQIPAGAANPAPPVGPALGQHGVNIMQFCQAFNAQTQDKSGTIIPVEITVYEDKSFTFVCKTPPAAVLIKEKLGIKGGTARSMGVRIEGREMKKKYIPSRKVAAMLQGKSIDE